MVSNSRRERLLYKKWLHLSLNNGFVSTSTKFAVNKRTRDKKIRSHSSE